MTTFEARINFPADAVAPDAYNASHARIPPDNFVVSRNKDGSVASTYGELSWNRTPYDPDGRTRYLHFTYWENGDLTAHRERLTRELRWVMFLLIYMRTGSPLSNSSLCEYLVTLRLVARLCETRSVRVQDALSDPVLAIESLGDTMSQAGSLGRLITLLGTLGNEVVGYDVSGKSTIATLKSLHIEWSEKFQQHPPIPTRIYSSILSFLSRELEDFEHIADKLLRLYTDCRRDPLLGRDKSRQRVIKRQMNLDPDMSRPELKAVLGMYGLEEFFISKGFVPSIDGISTALTEIMMIATIQIQAFTGMRRNEVSSLPYNCLHEIKRDGRTHYVINGRVTKLSKGLVKRTQWVTSDAGRRAVLLVQRIAEAIYTASGQSPSLVASQVNSSHLFIAPQLKKAKEVINPTRLNLNAFPKLRARLQPVITEADLHELEQIDPHRAWRTEESFQVGKSWTFTGHQLRRSLALYAQRSGLVSLPSLKRQLQHITQEMSSYYARGSAFAEDFIGGVKNHFGNDWQETQPVSQFLSYAAHVLLTDEVLFGAHPNWVDQRLKGSNGIVMFDRTATLKRFKQGQLSFRETPIGGCVKVGECNLHPSGVIEVECLSTHCKNIVGSLPKLERVIAAQTHRVEKLRQIDPKSPECRNEVADLAILTATRDNVLKSHQKRLETV